MTMGLGGGSFEPVGVELQVRGQAEYIAALRMAAGVTGGIFVAAAGIATTALVGLAVAAGGVAATITTKGISAAMEFESAMVGLRRTMEPTDAQFHLMTQDIQALAERIPYTVVELGNIATEAGRMGIRGRESVAIFTEAMADVLTTSEFTAEGAIRAYTRLSLIMQEPITNIKQVTAAATELDNAMATSEMEIVQFAVRMAAAGKQAGFTTAEVLGISAAFRELGIPAERGGSAIQMAVFKIISAIGEGGKQLELFAAVAGVSAAQFTEMWSTDPAEAFTLFVEGLGKAGDKGDQIMKALGLGAIRTVQAFLTVSEAGDTLRKAINNSNQGFEAGNATQKEAQRVYNTTASQVKTLQNSINNLWIEIGREMLPVFRDTLSFLKTQVMPTFVRFSQFIRIDLMPVIKALAEVLGRQFVQAAGNGSNAALGVMNAGEAAAMGLGQFAISVINLIEQLGHLLGIAGRVKDVLFGFIAVGRDAFGAVTGDFNSMKNLFENWDENLVRIGDAFGSFGNVVEEGAEITRRAKTRNDEFLASLARIREEARAFATTIDGAKVPVAELTDALDHLTDPDAIDEDGGLPEYLGLVDDLLDKTGKAAKEAETALEGLGISVDDARAIMIAFGMSADEADRVLVTMGADILDLGGEVENVGVSTNRLTAFLAALGVEAADIPAAIDRISASMAEVQTWFEKTGTDVDVSRDLLIQLGYASSEVDAKLITLGADANDVSGTIAGFNITNARAIALLQEMGLTADEAAKALDKMRVQMEETERIKIQLERDTEMQRRLSKTWLDNYIYETEQANLRIVESYERATEIIQAEMKARIRAIQEAVEAETKERTTQTISADRAANKLVDAATNGVFNAKTGTFDIPGIDELKKMAAGAGRTIGANRVTLDSLFDSVSGLRDLSPEVLKVLFTNWLRGYESQGRDHGNNNGSVIPSVATGSNIIPFPSSGVSSPLTSDYIPGNTVTVNANYAETQQPVTIRQDLEALRMAGVV